MGLEARMPPLQPDVDALDNEASPIVEAASELPVLTATPTAYSGCCLALSKPLIAYFAPLLPQSPSLALSIGSGFGFLEPLAAEATNWLFVYPRRVGLVREYLAEYGQGSVKRVVWAGPKADWDDYKTCFADWHVQEQSAELVGGRAWELIAVADKATP